MTTESAIDLAKRQHAADRDAAKRQLIRDLDSLISVTDSVRKSVENEDKITWWADHSQGLAESAVRVERLLNRLITWDRAVATLGAVEQHVHDETEGTSS